MSPISSPSIDSLIGISAAPESAASNTPAEIEGTGVPATNWLTAWLGQTQSSEEAGEPSPTGTSAASFRQVQWLTLLPSVPAFQDLLAPLAMDEIAQDETNMDDEELGSGIAAPVIPQISAAPVPPATETPVNIVAPKAGRIETIQQRTEPLASPPDKGELIWEAEFVVAEKAPEPVEIADAGSLTETALAARRDRAAVAGTEMRDSRQRSPEEQSPERRQGEGQSRRPAAEAAVEPSATGKPTEPVQRKSPQSPAGTFEAPVLEAVTRGNTKVEFRSPAATAEAIGTPAAEASVEPSATGKPTEPVQRETPPSPAGTSEVVVPNVAPQGNTKVEFRSPAAAAEATGTTAAVSVEPEAARPLRPTRIATLYVDVPTPGGEADAGTIRLAVSQRGDQVNVRLRSWDAGATPIENDRMQPLLQSLAEQGYAANSGNNDQQPSQNADDRQRKNQERQEQAFLLRRQFKNQNTEQFDLQAQIEGFSNSQQQGAFR